jgi:hypothetical protein
MAWIFAAVFIGGLLLSYTAMPKTESARPAGLDEFKVPTAEVGREIPVLFGTKKIQAPNVVWFGDLKLQPVKKKGGKK